MERVGLIDAHQSGCYSVTELAERYGVGRATVYRWLARYRDGGAAALCDLSHARHHQAHRTPEVTEQRLVQVRQDHPSWGPRKVVQFLAREEAGLALPASSTVGSIFDRHGLTQHRRARRHPLHPGSRPLHAEAPNEVWTADFKGQFRTRDGRYCFPLTVCDAHSRFILDCHGLPQIRREETTRRFQRLFTEYGLPAAIRTDNGPPFATQALCGLSRLSVWWIKLGITHQRIDPGRPQQNGRHERMHRTLKAETARPPEANAARQQRRFDAWRTEFNTCRPHAALDGATPASRYAPSTRAAPAVAPAPEYPGHYERRRVSHHGSIKWSGRELFVSHALNHEILALTEVDDGIWSLYFYDRMLARFDERAGVLVP
jgi:transposase InsO family protein